MNQALNLVANVVGKGTKRRREKAISMADPLTMRIMLYEKELNQLISQISRTKPVRTHMFRV